MSALIANPGYIIPAISEKRLIAALPGATIHELIGRQLDHVVLSTDRLKSFDKNKELVKDHVDPEKLPNVSRTFGIMKSMDLVPTHLRDWL